MDIHIVGINYWPEKTGIAVFSRGRAEYLATRGHRVTMCTGVPYYPQWRVEPGYRWRPFRREQRNGVDILRCPLYVPARVTTIRRVLHEASFVATSLIRSLFARRPDLILIVSPPLALGFVGVLLSRVWRVPYVFHVEDLQPDAALDLGMVRPGRMARVLYGIEGLAYRKAALVSTLTASMRNRILSKGVPEEKVAVFSSWADPELFTTPPRVDAEDLRRTLGLSGAFIVLHAGNMGVKQGLDVVIDAANQTRAMTDLLYVLVGDGAMRRSLEARVAELDLVNVRMLGLLPQDQFLQLLAIADVCVVTQQATVADIVFPSKVLTLLAAGKPVVASVNAASEVARVIVESGAGPVVAPGDAAALSAAIDELRRSASVRERHAHAGRAYAKLHWERNATLTQLSERLESVLRDENGTGLKRRAGVGLH